jgi:hypothetical protein
VTEDFHYYQKVKIIPFDLLENHFNGLSLAHWYMGDGYFENRSNTNRSGTLKYKQLYATRM